MTYNLNITCNMSINFDMVKICGIVKSCKVIKFYDVAIICNAITNYNLAIMGI